MAPRSLHPGVTADQVKERTGFPIEVPPRLPVTAPPGPDEIAILRAADPLEVRKLEFSSGKDAAEKFAAIYERERQTLHAAWPRRRH